MRGLTLLETLISLLIFSVVMIALGLSVVVGKNSLFTSDVPTELRQNVLFALTSVSRELRETTGSKTNLGSGTSNNSITFQVPNDNNADGQVVDNIGNIEWGANITYARNAAGKLTRTQGGVTSIITPNISYLQFSRPAGNDKLIQVDITVAKINNTGNWQDAEQAILKMRN